MKLNQAQVAVFVIKHFHGFSPGLNGLIFTGNPVMKRHFLPPIFRSWRFAAFSWRGWRLGLAAQLAVDGLQGFVHSEKQNQPFKEYAHVQYG